ncbi:MAG TPA: HIT domain-containing protein [Bellilinea sp.]|nr:HIT domain-containing protein [Bellilinea sp.]
MGECIFCKIVDGKIKSWKVYEDESVFAFLDVDPANEYHTLVIPKNHDENIFDIPENELKEMMVAVKNIVRLFNSKLGIRNVQIINSSGAEAQQDVFHMHFHVVPRKTGDGQDIKWTTHPDWAERFGQLLAELK